MILAEIEIQDYKQFHGVHRFTPPPEGIVAVIGHNGAGKTTLFEAIEWCLYKPNAISAGDVPTRGQAAKPRVKVVLLDPATGTRYVITRSLKRGVASAEIYLEHDAESRIVEGSRQVTEHVARDLIGLSHTAFVSTFFTRQKELSFFGTMKETERRREVGRLLGMETIREAQTQIADERKIVQSEATWARQSWEAESAERDFGAELEASESSVEAARQFVIRATAAHAEAAAAHEAARTKVEVMREVQRQDAAIAQSISESFLRQHAARRRRDQARGELGRLDGETARRAELVDHAAEIPARQAEVDAHQQRKAARDQQRRLELDRERAAADEARDGQKVVKAIRDSAVTDRPGWRFASDDLVRLPSSLDDVIAVARSVDAAAAKRRADALSEVVALETRRTDQAAKTERYRQKLAQLVADREQLAAAGDPTAVIASLSRDRQTTTIEIEQQDARERTARQEIDKFKPVVARLRRQQLGDVCPTCQRPYTESELEVLVPTLEEKIAEANRSLDEVAACRRRLSQRLQTLDRDLDAETDRAARINALAGSIENGRNLTETEERELAEATAVLQRRLDAAGLAEAPNPDAVSVAAAEAEKLARIAGALPVLVTLRDSLARHREDRELADAALAELGDVQYDDSAHRAASAALQAAQEAASAIQEIERQLERRPEVELDLVAASNEMTAEQAKQAELEAERTALGFESDALEIAVAKEREHLAAEHEARDARGFAASKLTMAERDHEQLIADQARITKLAEQAEAKGREADTLNEMYEEFNGFERFVAQRLAPALAESTAEFLSAITDGRYDSVNVTESYGIEVYDGPQESFPIEQFSGGERDVIALCARLALSRLIGGQAHHPPGFLVLDEVFGSLDRDRRLHVLETLGTLSSATDAFKQLFIISHVDDVRSSPIFNEVWRISEDADGVSRLENLGVTGGVDE